MILTGKKVFLRELTPDTDDFGNYLGWLRDTQNNSYIEAVRKNYTMEELIDYVNLKNSSLNVLFFGIFTIEPQRLIGTVKLEPIDRDIKEAWLGVLIGDPADHRKGFGFDALTLILNHARNDLNLKKIFLGVNPANIPAIYLYEKIGFHFDKSRGNVMFIDISY
jgi:RimJ/RimL family protein N-acetyltransferase